MLEKILSHPWLKKWVTHPIFSKFLNYEFITYIICGVLTTLINWGAYYLLDLQGISTMLSTAIAWLIAVIFAYFVNKIWVFRSYSWAWSIVWSEFVPFITCRILSGIFDVIFMVVAVDFLHCNKAIAKILSNIFVMLANYFASKFIIFKNK
ncbi:MAG: GtrA family protein [Lachnospiraceae bacterium]